MNERKQSISTHPSRARSASYTQTTYVSDPDVKRNHLASVSSVSSSMSDTLDKFENTPSGKGKIYLRDDVDLEQQIIITAGGRKEYIMCFLFKLLVLMLVVIGCGVLVFYAL